MMISREYRAEQNRMHKAHPEYGVECLSYIGTLVDIIDNHDIRSMLDYGSGKGRIVPAIANELDPSRDLEINLYDPAIPEISAQPEPAQLVTCIDVLEHVEPEFTINVLDDIAHCVERIVFITIGLTPAAKTLSDGRNAHINLRPIAEWIGLLVERFQLTYCVNKGRSLVFVGTKL